MSAKGTKSARSGSENRQRARMVGSRMTQDESDEVAAVATAHGMTLSSWVRTVMLDSLNPPCGCCTDHGCK